MQQQPQAPVILQTKEESHVDNHEKKQSIPASDDKDDQFIKHQEALLSKAEHIHKKAEAGEYEEMLYVLCATLLRLERALHHYVLRVWTLMNIHWFHTGYSKYSLRMYLQNLVRWHY